MSDTLAKRVRAAAGAGWTALILFWLLMLASWVAMLAILKYEPPWLLTLWGGRHLDWDTVHTLILWTFAAMKIVLWPLVLVVVWLTFWARRLRRLEQQNS